MATYEVKERQLHTYINNERNLSSQLKRLNSQIENCRNNLKTSVSSANYKIKSNLTGLCNQFDNEIGRISKMADVLDATVDLYFNTEKSVCGIPVKRNKPSDAQDVKSSAEWSDILFSVIKEAGLGGKTIDLINNLLNGKTEDKNLLESITKYMASAVGTVAETVSSDAPDWVKAFTGWSKETYLSAKDYLKKETDDYILDITKTGSKKVAETVRVAAKWLGVALTGVFNFQDNFEEFKAQGGMANQRFWEETVVETVIDVGKDVLVGTAIVGVAAACGIAAPAWAIAGGTALILGGADFVSKKLTEKDLTEFISDTALNFRDGVNEGLKNFSSWVGSKVTSVFNLQKPRWCIV